MLELTTINTMELTNKKLGTQLNNIKKAVDIGSNQQWKIAEAIATIVDNDLFVDDFETEGNLAKMLGMSRCNLNKMKNASHYHNEIEELKPFSLSKVMEMLVIPQSDVVKFLDDYMVTATNTCKEVREAVSAWKDDNVVADAHMVEDTETDNETTADNVAGDNESTGSSTPNTESDLATIEKMIDNMETDDLIALKEYIEKRL